MTIGFGAARLRARSDLRGHWRLLVTLALVVGGVAGVLIGSVAGARRTASSYERLERATSAPDVVVAYGGCAEDGSDDVERCMAEADETLPRIAGLPGVQATSVLDAYNGVFRE